MSDQTARYAVRITTSGMAVRTGASKNVCASVAHECSLAPLPARVKRATSRELRERHARGWNGLERFREMIQHWMRLAG